MKGNDEWGKRRDGSGSLGSPGLRGEFPELEMMEVGQWPMLVAVKRRWR